MPNKDKLLELRKKKAEAKKKETQQSQKQFLDAVDGLHSLFDKQHKQDLKATEDLLKELKKLDTFNKELSAIKTAVKNIPKTDKVKVSNLSDIKITQQEVDLTEVAKAIEDLTKSVNEQSVVMIGNKKAEDYIPTRRVRAVNGRLIFDDAPMKVDVIGGGGGIINNYSKEEANDVRFDPDETAPVYIGTNQTLNTLTSSNSWYISKFTRDGNGKATRIQRRKGSWDDRAIGW